MTRAGARPTGPARLTPAQERTLREIGELDAKRPGYKLYAFFDGTSRHAAQLAKKGLMERITYGDFHCWRITPAGRAWLAAREGEDARPA